MSVIARDAVASDQLVYAWPFPIGPTCEVSCASDEQVVMCPAWMVADRLGPGRHHWRTPDPSRPVSAFFVLTAGVQVTFDMTTSFLIPATGQPVRLRAAGSLQVRCTDPGLLIAQFVGLPFDHINEGILRSVSRSIERMLARLLTRRVVMASSPIAVTDPGMLPGIIEELVAYNPTAGAVFGVELIQMGRLTVVADDGAAPQIALPASGLYTPPPNGNPDHRTTAKQPAEQARGSGVTTSPARATTIPPTDKKESGLAAASGEIVVRAMSAHDIPPARVAGAIEVPTATEGLEPSAAAPPTHRAPTAPLGIASRPATVPGMPPPPLPGPVLEPEPEDLRGSIMGIGMSSIGAIGVGTIAGEIPTKVAAGGRVLVPGPNGLMQSATVRQLLQGYYELEVGHSGETIWVPINGVVPE